MAAANGLPDPARILTRRDFAVALTRVREMSGLTVREVAKAADVPASSLGDYYVGRHLPPLRADRLPAILRACGLDDSREIEGWLEALRRVRPRPGPRSQESRAPYLGLASFQVEDAEWFFGREALTSALVARVLERREGVLAVTGPSGSGKSSLLRAGLIPALAATATPLLVTPGADPVGELAHRLAGLAGRSDEIVAEIRGAPERAAELVTEPLVVIADQFEEVFTGGCTEAARTAYLRALRAIGARPSAAVVIGLRADFYARALRHRELAEILQTSQIVVGPMSETELRRAITAPAHKAEVSLEEGLADLLIGDLRASAHDPEAGDAGALPLLSHALLETWQRRHRRTLTIADYRASGGIGGAVARTAETAYAGLSGPRQRIARQIFLRLVYIADGTGDTRRRITPGELPPGEEVTGVLDHFIEQRLITVTDEEFDLVHEALLGAWPRLRTWLDEDRAGLRTHRRLTFAAEVWRDSAYDPSTLLRTERLADAAEWAEDSRNAAGLNALERDFLAAALDHERAERRSVRRRVRRRQQLIAVLVALSLAASALAAFAFRQRTLADDQRDLAISRRVAVEAGKLRAKDVDLAGQLSLAAYQVAPTQEARSGLLESYSGPGVTRVLGSPGVLQSVAFTPDGKRMATGGTDRTVRLWNVADRAHPVPAGPPLRGHRDTVYSVVFGPGGRLASGGGDGAVYLWGPGGHAVRMPAGPRSTVYSVAFSPDGRTLAAGSADSHVYLWDLTGAPVPLTGPGGAVQSVAFSPDGRTLAAGTAGGSVRLWSLAGRPRPLGARRTASAKAVFAVAFSPDGQTLASGGADDTVRLWSLPGLKPLGRPLTGPKGWVNSVAFAPAGRALAAAGSDGRVWIWDRVSHANIASLPHPGPVTAVVFLTAGSLATAAADGTARIWDLPGPVLSAPGGDIFSTTVSAHGHVLATATSGNTARLWNLADPRHPTPLSPVIGDDVRVGRASGASGLSPDGRTLAVGGVDGGSQLWDVADPAHPVPLPLRLTGPAAAIQGYAFRPDGRLLAAASNDRKIWLWDITDPRHPVRLPAPLTGPANYAYAPAFSPDGRTVAAGSADFHVYLWDVTDPRRPAALGGPLTGHTGYTFTTAFSPDGRTLATGSADNRVLLWDVTDRRHPRAYPVALTGPENYVWSVAYDGTGRRLAATAGDGSVWMWDVRDPRHPEAVATIAGSPDAVYTDVFDPDRPVLVTAGVGGTVRLWNTDPAQVAAGLCASAGTPITRTEWSHYLPERPYRPPCAAR
ncbi:helix-turn-helix domain-containing protein [Actinomadura sp. DC4]|uniref:nSTAND1 domain-containing NTPase n=1 Tax=Actinomadura sp. DC4 TaxID=3055069 RepID=UPI0025B1A469|nr:helix-turn-helix domain-containing protein [Actinomadura sp. DC4]MDN3353807.1 helix-turn-helix domain-containing protein [Actinomadura sp. DC4]